MKNIEASTAIVPAFLRPPQAAEYLSMSLSSLNRLYETSDFPKKVHLGKRCVGWRRSDIDKWLLNQGRT